jgi:hypothetical protein
VTGHLLGETVLAVLVVVTVLVLPGFGLRLTFTSVRRWRQRLPRPIGACRVAETRPSVRQQEAAAIVPAVALSLCYCVLAGSALLAFQVFTPTRLAVLLLLAAVVGLVPFVWWCARHWVRLGLHVLLIAAFAAPISVSIFSGGYRAAQSYEWFYWGLGRQLAIAHGVPAHVLEWGNPIRWQPDYLNFNLLTQAYLGLMRGVADPTALAVWRLPMTLLVLAMTFLTLRLWFSLVPAATATAALSGTNLYIDKIGNNTPEAVGLAFGLVAVWLAVEGLRRRRSSWLLLAGVTGGLTISVHAVAGTVCAFLLVAALVIELVVDRSPVSWWLPVLGSATLASFLVVATLGVTLQGRASPLGDAKNPTGVNGSDPTYLFVQYNNGHFTTPVNSNSVHSIAAAPWPDSDLFSLHWAWLLGLVGVGLVGVILVGRSRARRGVAVALLFVGLIAAALAYFQLRYDTFVPQHTGNVRIASYVPIAYVILLAAGIEVLYGLVVRWWPETRPRVLGVALGAVVPALAIGFFAATTVPIMASRPALSTRGSQALAELERRAPIGSVVATNVATRGTLEYFTDLEAPSEGRQPLIEDPRTLDSAVQYLVRLNRFLQDPHPGQLQRDLGAGWFLLAKHPLELGTRLNYGRPTSRLAHKAGLEVVWQRKGVRIFKAPGASSTVDSVGPAKSLRQRYLVGLVVLVLVLWLLALGVSRADRTLSRNKFED